MEKKIQTLNPDPAKKGVNIDKMKYDMIKSAIVQILEEEGEISFQDLMARVETNLEDKFSGSISWYYTTVKLDLEARGFLERLPDRRPQMLRLSN